MMNDHDITALIAAQILSGLVRDCSLEDHEPDLRDAQWAVGLALDIRQEVIVQTRARREKVGRAEQSVEYEMGLTRAEYERRKPWTPPDPETMPEGYREDRRRPFGGWDTQEQQDADDAHRRTERRTPGTVEVDPARGWVPTVPPEPGRSLDSLDPRD